LFSVVLGRHHQLTTANEHTREVSTNLLAARDSLCGCWLVPVPLWLHRCLAARMHGRRGAMEQRLLAAWRFARWGAAPRAFEAAHSVSGCMPVSSAPAASAVHQWCRARPMSGPGIAWLQSWRVRCVTIMVQCCVLRVDADSDDEPVRTCKHTCWWVACWPTTGWLLAAGSRHWRLNPTAWHINLLVSAQNCPACVSLRTSLQSCHVALCPARPRPRSDYPNSHTRAHACACVPRHARLQYTWMAPLLCAA
jgi:hypothetical protein